MSMTNAAAILQDQLKRVKFRMQILDLIEDRLREMKALAQRVAWHDLNQGEIDIIQKRVNELAGEITFLERLEAPDLIH
ncbi:hypothetical protein B0537_12545 [Desulforamulus ferrireducens]|uniref:Uncharacterized protein n=2 Tax=Desulforamulus ferrireducens TaxID=1833852 RepID=A0A1S6IYJ5_9FIRM|nr:hypothetical protein B0537_12545 [Desulforamulus ferrireducens]